RWANFGFAAIGATKQSRATRTVPGLLRRFRLRAPRFGGLKARRSSRSERRRGAPRNDACALPPVVAGDPAAVAEVLGAAVDISVVGEAGVAEAAVRVGRVPGGKARAAGGVGGGTDRHGDVGAARMLATHALDFDHLAWRRVLHIGVERKWSGC